MEHLFRPAGTFPSKGKVLTSSSWYHSGRCLGDDSSSRRRGQAPALHNPCSLTATGYPLTATRYPLPAIIRYYPKKSTRIFFLQRRVGGAEIRGHDFKYLLADLDGGLSLKAFVGQHLRHPEADRLAEVDILRAEVAVA